MLKNDYLRDKITNEWKLTYILDLPSSIPLSLIAKDFEGAVREIETNDVLNLNELCWKEMNALFDKYIDSNCALEINLSYAKRSPMADMFKNNDTDVQDLCFSMEQAVIEISRLMDDSFHRYKEAYG